MNEETRILFSIAVGIFTCGLVGTVVAYYWPMDVREAAGVAATFAVLGFGFLVGIISNYFLDRSQK